MKAVYNVDNGVLKSYLIAVERWKYNRQQQAKKPSRLVLKPEPTLEPQWEYENDGEMKTGNATCPLGQHEGEIKFKVSGLNSRVTMFTKNLRLGSSITRLPTFGLPLSGPNAVSSTRWKASPFRSILRQRAAKPLQAEQGGVLHIEVEISESTSRGIADGSLVIIVIDPDLAAGDIDRWHMKWMGTEHSRTPTVTFIKQVNVIVENLLSAVNTVGRWDVEIKNNTDSVGSYELSTSWSQVSWI